MGIAIPARNCAKEISKNVLVHNPNIFSNSDVALCENLKGEKNNTISSKQHQDFKLENSSNSLSCRKKWSISARSLNAGLKYLSKLLLDKMK